MSSHNIVRFKDELAQAWTIAIKDVRVYYLRPGMIMFGLLMPFFMFFSFSVQRGLGASEGLARLLALTVFFTAAAAGPSSSRPSAASVPMTAC
jgi:ABC-2 type transport system permease protein